MQKIIFVSIILLIGLFSLQLSMRTSFQNYYGEHSPKVEEVQIVQPVEHIPWDRYELVVDSTGKYSLVERETILSL